MKEIAIITGPTASGKTSLALDIARRVPVEIISMDSRQVYRGMDIGTAKATPEEQAEVPHHLIDIIEPGERFTTANFADRCNELIPEIESRGHVPLIVGGTPLCMTALLGGFDFCQADADMEYRELLNERARAEGGGVLHAELEAVDPEEAARLHPNDKYRVIRALEIFHLTGRKPSDVRSERPRTIADKQTICGRAFKAYILYMNREKLYHLINIRTAAMFGCGLMEETERLMSRGEDTCAFLEKTIGYAQAMRLIRGETDRAAAIAEAARDTRRFAKRQMTWFRSFADTVSLDRDQMSAGDIADMLVAAVQE